MTRKLSKLTRVSSLAIAAALTASATAQSFLGDPTVTFGSVNITEGAGTSDFDVLSTTAVIDWTPDDNAVGNFGAIAFQQSGTTATYSSTSDFAVLNRINVADPSRMVGLNGTINSLVSGQTGGSIFFYSPSGFVIGSSAVINVGSLILSASPIAVDGNGNFINGTTVTFNQASNPSAAVTTVAGSQITALNEGSYVALVAPRVEHHGNINVNGAAALVGAEAATINFRAGGLFDIQVDVGTTDANGVVADGTITGPASSGGGDNHRAYLVAVPKNDALTMLIGAGASLGFDIAGAADVVGNAVVLSAGHDISFGDTTSEPSAAGGADANLSIGNANFTSALYGRADGNVSARSVDGSMTFASDASLRGRDQVTLEAWGGGNVSVAGNLTMSANATGTGEGESAAAGNVTLQALGSGTLSVAGDTVLTAVGQGGFSSTPGVASGDGTGGTILVQSTSGGDMTLGGTLDADAGGYGGSFNGDIDGGDGFGGTVNVFTSGGSSMSVFGSAFLRADGQAGQPSDCFCGGLGGIGDGGTVNVQAHSLTGNVMDFGDVLFIYANGYGGDSHTGDGGLGRGGDVSFSAMDGSVVTVATDVSIQADGVGGTAFGGVGNGGNGIGGGSGGGNVQTFASNGGSLQITGNFITSVDGYGGQSESGTGGSGTGGLGQLFATGSGDVSVGASAFITAAGRGGDGLTGGAGTGGRAYFSSSSGGSLAITGFAELSALGTGGNAFGADNFGGDAGDGQGGHAEAYANAGTLTFDSVLFLDASGEGGRAGALQAHSGDGFGGDVFLQAIGGGTLSVAQSLFAFADGTGGSPDFGVYSGNGTGGTITVVSRDGTSSLTVAGPASLGADGSAGAFSECSTACSNGGTGQGGQIFIGSSGVLTGSTLEFDSTLWAWANGYGGDSAIIDPDSNVTVDGGEGIGGTVSLFANDGNSVSVDGQLTIEAIGYGGYDPAGLVGGNGTGGMVQIATNSTAGNLITLGSDVFLDASGRGGDSGIVTVGDGGDGTGGSAQIYAAGGDINIAGSAFLEAVGEGGEAFGGTGGDGFGGQTLVGSDGGAIHIVTNLFMDGGAIGGDGDTGGNAVGLVSDPLDETQPIAAAIYTGTGGSIIVDGNTGLSAQAEGGDGINGNGGNATAGEVDVVAYFGDIVLNSLSIGVNAYGGSGGNGGSGGDALAGNVDVAFGFGAAAVGGTITLGSAFITADGFGGAGGAGQDANFGGNGGAGGDGTGGHVLFAGSAAGGTLDSGAATITARGEGGVGGAGGNGDTGTGGAGGAGGVGQGGFIQTGTVSADQAPGSGGGATYTTLSLDTSGFGGAGGNGGTGGGGGGAGGDGGDAFGGQSNFLVRGVLVTADSVQLFAGATGGDGGTGSTQGNGGDATTGFIAVEAKDRFGHPAERGTMDVGTIVGSAIALGGTGALNGTSTVADGSYFRLLNGDATIGSISIQLGGDTIDTTDGPSLVSVRDGTATIGLFSFITTGQLALDASNGSMTADTIILSAATFVPDTFNPPPSSPGTYFAGSFDITTGGDFITNANLDSDSDLTINAPGIIAMADVTAAGFVDLDANGGSLTAGDLSAQVDVTLDASGAITTGDITTAGGNVIATGGSIDVGNVNAAQLVALMALAGDLGTGNIDGGIGVTLDATGAITAGDISSFGTVDANGGSVTLGDVSGSVLNFISTVGDISTGDLVAFSQLTVNSADDFLFGSIIAPLVQLNAPGSIIGGDIDSETDISAVAGVDIDVGDLSAGGFTGEGFVEGSVVLTAGNGSVNTGLIDAFGSVAIGAGDTVGTGDINAQTTVDIVAVNDIGTGNIFASDGVAMDAGGSISTGDIDSGSIDLLAAGDISTGHLNTQLQALALGDEVIALLFPGASVTLQAGGDISTGNISSIDGVYANAGGGISTGSIDALDFVQLLAGADVLTGTITAGSFIDIFTSGGDIATGDLFGTEIDLEAGGDILFADVDADSIDFEAGGEVTGGDIVVSSFATGDAEGAVTLGDITAGPTIPVDDFSVGMASATSVTVGDVVGAGPVGFATLGDLITGNLSGSNLVMTLVGGDISTGSITTAANGRVYMADVSMFLDNGGPDDFDALAVLALDPVATGGSITIGGPVSTGLVQAAAGSDFSAVAISADQISARAGGTATVGGAWSAGDVRLISNDIDITANGSISAGDIDLVSTNVTQTIVGDGIDLPGYHLSDAEYDRLNANDINVIADTSLGAAPSMLIGDLSVDASGGEGGIEYEFRTYNGETEVSEGSIRILGDAIFTGMGVDDAVGFLTGTFELDAATGLLSLENSPGTLGGTLFLNASHIHVASGDILDQLAIDPQYDGYQEDLNAPADVQRPDGVIRAASIEIEFADADLNTLYVQNTGTSETPAGFLVSDAVLFGDSGDVTPPPGSIDLIINGQIVTDTGTLTGIDVRDALVEAEGDLAPFTGNSTINGCPLVGDCGPVEPPEPPIPPDFQPSPGIQKEITLITDNLLPPPEFGNEDFIDDNNEETDEGATSPIEPPQPLFDTSALGGKGDVDDPVSGSGNPALMETTPSTPNQEKQP